MMIEQSLPVCVPRLRTRRLLLREYRMADFDAVADYLADESSMALVGAHDRRTAWRIFGCGAGGWLLQGIGGWAVEMTASGALVGLVGAFFRDGCPEIEISWNTFQTFWGQGIATEAAEAVVQYLLDVRGEERVTALVDHGNAASLRVAAHLGMTYETDTVLFGVKVGRYVRSASKA